MLVEQDSKNQPPQLSSEKIRAIVARIDSASLIRGMADIFKVLNDPARLKIVLSMQEGELCVSHIAELTELTQSSVSHHLKTLRQTRLVDFRRQGKLIFYALKDDHISALLAVARDHANETL